MEDYKRHGTTTLFAALDVANGQVLAQSPSLQHHDLEHQHRIVRRPAALGRIRARQRSLQLRSEQLEIGHQRQSLERIARRRQRRIPPLPVKEPRLTRHLHHCAAVRSAVATGVIFPRSAV
jgi:hypothetical protein